MKLVSKPAPPWDVPPVTGIYPDHRGTIPDATSPTSGGADSCRRIPAHRSCVVGKTPLAQWKNHRL